MSLDHAVQYPCPVRVALSADDLLRLRHDTSRTQAIVSALRRDPAIDKRRPEAEWTFNARVRTAVGIGERTLRVGDLLEEVAPLVVSPHIAETAPPILPRPTLAAAGRSSIRLPRRRNAFGSPACPMIPPRHACGFC